MHEVVLATCTWLAPLIWGHVELLSQEVLEDVLFSAFCMLLGPFIDPSFDLFLLHVFLCVHVVWTQMDGKVALGVQPVTEFLQLKMPPQGLQLADVMFDLLRRLGLLHLLDLGDEGDGCLIQNICR